MSIEKHETYADITAELRALSKSEELSIGAQYHKDHPTVCGKSICVYLAVLADRIKEAAWHEERIMLSLMLYAVDDYVEDWASEKFKTCVHAACRRLGIEYRPSATCL